MKYRYNNNNSNNNIVEFVKWRPLHRNRSDTPISIVAIHAILSQMTFLIDCDCSFDNFMLAWNKIRYISPVSSNFF